MQIIPVLDLKGGLVVRGVGGNRAAYRPIESPLAATAEPLDVARGLMGLAGFAALYIADLDAIAGAAPALSIAREIQEAFPSLSIWLDAGISSRSVVETLLAIPRLVPVVGSESLGDTALLAACREESRLVLSLDFRGDTFLGPAGLCDDAALWPGRVIAMTLARVGSGEGPDLARLAAVKERAGRREIFAAGGVRDESDLAALDRAGIAGALVSSALHDGRLDREMLTRFAQ